MNRYGGPGSQRASASVNRDWHYYLAGTLKYVVVMVDGRGTGLKGRTLRNPVRRKLGQWETVDQINAARYKSQSRTKLSGADYYLNL